MALTLIVGPMKSGKSLELIARTAPYEFAKDKVLYVQSKRNVRDGGISSRIGLGAPSLKVSSLSQVDDVFDIIAIDEIHMFNLRDVAKIRNWLSDNKEIIVSGLDLDYRGKFIPIIAALFELKPESVINKLAVCEVCRQYQAQYTQILQHNKPITKGLPAVVPEDGKYDYQPRCRNCFVSI